MPPGVFVYITHNFRERSPALLQFHPTLVGEPSRTEKFRKRGIVCIN